MVMKDQYTLIERSDTLIEQSYRTLFGVCSQHHGLLSSIFKLVFLLFFLRISQNFYLLFFCANPIIPKLFSKDTLVIGKISSIIGAGLLCM